MDDPYNLQRFVDAQDASYERARAELVSGRKASHWMWFVFPQIAGLGHSFTARKYAISSLAEARAYLAHAVLGPRLEDCTRIVNDIENKSIREIFGSPDDLKFCSSMTLFAIAAPDENVFQDALKKYCDAAYDPLTVERL